MAKERSVDIIVRARDQASGPLKAVSGSFHGLGRTVFNVKNLIAGALGGLAVGMFVRDVVQAFGAQEDAERGLSDALDLLSAGGAAAMADMNAFAAEIQRTTTVGDEAVLELAKLGAGLGRLSGQALKDATRAAIGLAERLGTDTTAAMRLVARAAIGDTAQLARYGIKLSESLSPQQKFNELLRMGSESFALAEGKARTMTGQLVQLGNIWGDLKEEIGAAIAPAVRRAVGALREAVPAVSAFIRQAVAAVGRTVDALRPAGQLIARIFADVRVVAMAWWSAVRAVFGAFVGILGELAEELARLGITWDWVSDGILGATRLIAEGFVLVYSAVETLATYWKTITVGMMAAGVAVRAALTSAFQHVFVQVIPQYLGWFRDNFVAILRDIGSAWITMWTNVIDNAGVALRKIRGKILGIPDAEAWKGLLDGFQSTIQKLPEIAERDKWLERFFATIAEGQFAAVGQGFRAIWARNRAEFGAGAGAVAGEAGKAGEADRGWRGFGEAIWEGFDEGADDWLKQVRQWNDEAWARQFEQAEAGPAGARAPGAPAAAVSRLLQYAPGQAVLVEAKQSNRHLSQMVRLIEQTLAQAKKDSVATSGGVTLAPAGLGA